MPKKKKAFRIKLDPHHKTDWKFVVMMVMLGVIAIGVLSVYKEIKASNLPEQYPVKVQEKSNFRQRKQDRQDAADVRNSMEHNGQSDMTENAPYGFNN